MSTNLMDDIRTLQRRVQRLEFGTGQSMASAYPLHNPAASVTTTSGTLQTIWSAWGGDMFGTLFQGELLVTPTPPVAGELRLRLSYNGNIYESPVYPIDSSTALYGFKWVPEDMPLRGGSWSFGIQVRRSSGAGSITTQPRSAVWLTSAMAVAGVDGGWYKIM